MGEKAIISASRRTDIPAFFAEWLTGRLKEGYCTVANPFRKSQVFRISLSPAEVEAIVFWTKNPLPLLAHKELLPLLESRYSFYFLFTLNGYPEVFEPALARRREEITGAFTELSRRYGSHRVIWRYDPIIISTVTGYDFHRRNFLSLAKRLSGFTERVIVSIVDHYRTVGRRFSMLEKTSAIKVFTKERLKREAEFLPFIRELNEMARREGIAMTSCSESFDLEGCGIDPGKCIDDRLISSIMRSPADNDGPENQKGARIYRKDPGQRELCLCTVSRDIGTASTCGHKCLYCYASAGDTDFSRTGPPCSEEGNRL
ncbi:MAG: DUF1848 domain-containing protein [Candidatus Eremiobacteraeota bacterium]|nr:DUF1848 domain-containing protein [Candidatus Eremiobacteraeota bacterium]